ncbi:3-phosphoshikimate 1-carboxyvinyltransferase [Flavobacterium suzhouense]|uniref:3-phosphoshikimate 1-carboxyvinyltransferase n=1 Tax=Flavobacterium suzhouense TaxID=1529638 RepID=A0ABW5NSW1_9FLAO
MDIRLHISKNIISETIKISGSKSETNRLLLLQSLYPGITIENASESDDSEAMRKALAGNDSVVDIHHAGTAMRFLTAYYAIHLGREVVLTGSSRMKERPIGVLVDALRALGADIEYTDNEGYPPLKIKGKGLTVDSVTIKANVSSQYITALLLIGAKFENGLEIILEGEITSRPYLEMTLSLLQEVGIKSLFQDNVIKVSPATGNQQPAAIIVESDWSSASYFYSIVALSEIGTSITLSSFKKQSLQGDRALADIYQDLGVTTEFKESTLTLSKTHNSKSITRNLKDTPDLAQTIAVSCFGLGIGCNLTGLHTLKIKETDRLEALKTEFEKLGAEVEVSNDTLFLKPSLAINAEVAINTYNDHRMAMAFAPLAIKVPIKINDAEVVSKSYPAFWEDLKKVGFEINTL